MELLERDGLLAELHGRLAEARRGDGRLVFIGGEAGVGKTSLVRKFASEVGGRGRLVEGACDPLTTPRPLGPFLDMAPDAASLLHASRTQQLIACRELLLSTPTVAIVEDVHWADEATLDALRYIGRRLEGAQLLLLVTFRDDEVGAGHPVRLLLGDLASGQAVRRLWVPPLSVEGVARLAHGRADAEALHSRTGGNPFYVTEALAAGAGIPPTVRDAVLARVARLSPSARSLLEEAAVIGPRPERKLLPDPANGTLAAIDECVERGLLRRDGDVLEFRHELARVALAESISPHRAHAIHTRLVGVLVAQAPVGVDFGRIAHHSEAAGDTTTAFHYAELAARFARGAGAHREAAEQFQRALRAGDSAEPAHRAALLDDLGLELHLTGQILESIDARREAAQRWQALGNAQAEALSRATLAGALLGAGRNADARASANTALALLEHHECAEQAMVLARAAYIHMLERENEVAVSVGNRAIEVGERFDATDALILARSGVGAALILAGDNSGVQVLESSLELSRAEGNDRGMADAWVNLGSALGEMYQLDRAEPYLLAGIEFCRSRDIDHSRLYCTAWLAIVRFLRGDWGAATDLADEVLAFPSSSVISQIMALLVLSRVRTRRGDPDAWQALDAALELAVPTATLQRLGPVHAARAEAAWLAGNPERAVREAGAPYEMAVRHQHPWHSGELAYWQGLGLNALAPAPWLAEPWKQQLAGDLRGAADAWASLGCTYESARALADSDDEADLREALATFERLGARPMVHLIARRLRDMGVRSIPRGPRTATRANAAGLTTREVEVLTLLCAGLQNQAIGERLTLSTRTVDHHVAAILRKLDVHTRGEAAARAADLGILQR